MGPPGPVQERQPAGGASQAARSVGVGPGRTPPDDRSIRELRTGSPLLRLSFGTGSSPTCQRRAAWPAGAIAIPLLGFKLPAMAPPPLSEQPDAAAPGAGAISRVLIVMGNISSPRPLRSLPFPTAAQYPPRFAHSASAAVCFFARVSLQRWRRRRWRSSTSSSSSRRPPANPCRCPPSPFFFLLVLFICVRLVLCSECDFIGLRLFRTVAGFPFCPFLLRGEQGDFVP